MELTKPLKTSVKNQLSNKMYSDDTTNNDETNHTPHMKTLAIISFTLTIIGAFASDFETWFRHLSLGIGILAGLLVLLKDRKVHINTLKGTYSDITKLFSKKKKKKDGKSESNS